jgi:dihydrofolate reductase
MQVSLIAAVAANGVIGREGALPWNLPDDRAFFRRKTHGHHVVMGRRTFEETGQPLDGRVNLVVSRNPHYRAPGCEVVSSVELALELARTSGESEVFVIGGAQIYAAALPVADRMYLTRIEQSFEGDTWFIEWNPAEWREVWRQHHPADARHASAFTFSRLERLPFRED